MNCNRSILGHNIVDLEMKAAEFTLSNNQPNAILCNLDRRLISPEVDALCENVGVPTLPRGSLPSYDGSFFNDREKAAVQILSILVFGSRLAWAKQKS